MTDSEKLDLLLNKVSTMQGDMSTIQENMFEMHGNISIMQDGMSEMRNDMSGMQKDLTTVKHKVSSIEITIENELEVNIMRIAEGHIDLSRNLSEVKRNIESLDSKMEVNDLFIRHHDSEIKKLKML